MHSRHWMKKIQVPIIWTIAILFVVGVVWWSVAAYVGGKSSQNSSTENTSVDISETVAYITKDGTPLDNQDYWITRADYEETVKNVIASYARNGQALDSYFDSAQTPSEMGVRYSVTNSLLDEKVMTYYARDKGVFPDDKTVETEAASLVKSYSENENIKAAIIQQFGSIENYQKLVEESIQQDLLQKNATASAIPDADSRYEKYFEENKADLKKSYEKVTASHILLTSEASALEVKDMIDLGKISFTDAASEFSIDTGSAAVGGSLGEFGRGQMVPEFEEAAFSAATDTLVGPVESQFGFHLIEVSDKVLFDTYEEFEKIPDFAQLKSDFVSKEFASWFADYKKAEDFGRVINDPDLKLYDEYSLVESDPEKEIAFSSELEEMIFNPDGELVLTDSYLPATLFVQVSDSVLSDMDNELRDLNSMQSLYESLPEDYAKLTEAEVETQLASLTDDSTVTAELKSILNDVKDLRNYESSTGYTGLDEVKAVLPGKQQAKDALNEKFETVVRFLYEELPNSNEAVEYMYNIDSNDPGVVYRYYDSMYSSDLKNMISDSDTYQSYINYYAQYFGNQARSYLIDYPLQRMESELNSKIINSDAVAKEIKAGALYIMIDAYQNLSNLPVPDELKELYIRSEIRYLDILKNLLPDDATIDSELQVAQEVLTALASGTSAASSTDTQD